MGNPKIKKKMVVVIKIGFSTQLCERKVLTPFISVVLNGNHLVSFVNKCLCDVIFFLLIITMFYLNGNKTKK